jgi:ABC-2 type transport system ATP-binding protein
MIEVEGVSKSLGSTQALDGVSFVVAPGTVHGLLGPNGAGKTTLVRILATLLAPDSGLARVAGLDVGRHPAAVRTVIGLAGQFAAVDEALTGRENLVMVGRLYRLRAGEARTRASETLERLALVDAADRPVKTYSGGMRRRLDLGASLVGRPRVLLLDEPTAGLDPGSRVQLWELVRELVAGGTTVLLTTQYLEEADHLSDHIVVIDRGRLIASGSPDELKYRVGSDLVELEVPAGDVERVTRLLRSIVGHDAQLTVKGSRVSLPVKGRVRDLMQVVRLLDGAGITPTDLTLRRPSLDDVFVALTARSTEEADPSTTRPPAQPRERGPTEPRVTAPTGPRPPAVPSP